MPEHEGEIFMTGIIISLGERCALFADVNVPINNNLPPIA